MPATPTTDREPRESFGTLEPPAVPEICAPLEAAGEVLEQERRQLTAERRAFKRFRRRVTALEPTTPTAAAADAGTEPSAGGIGVGTDVGTGVDAGLGGSVGTGTAGPAMRGSSSDGLSKVRDAYVETVMSVPHYDDVYGDTWLESVAEEFGEELAVALDQHARLHPQLQQSLATGAEQAIDSRTTLLEHVETEREAIADADRELTDLGEELRSLLEQPLSQLEFNALRLTRARLEGLRERCDELADERQAKLRRRRHALVIGDVGALERYFYDDCEHTYPVLAAIADLGEWIERATTAVDRSLEGLLELEYEHTHESGSASVDQSES